MDIAHDIVLNLLLHDIQLRESANKTLEFLMGFESKLNAVTTELHS